MSHVNQDLLVDKLCERLAVETHGVEIYEAAIVKLDDPTIVPRLKHFMQQEAEHRDLLAAYLDKLGVTQRETTSARLAKMEADTYLAMIGEADTPAQVLNILLTMELMDENAWEMIINLGRDSHDDEMVHTLHVALKQEKEHLRGVRGMFSQLTRAMMVVPEREAVG